MTTAAAGNTAGQAADKEKEKTGMRRALGRGLASLLPGPRAVATPPAAASVAAPASQASATEGSGPRASAASSIPTTTVVQPSVPHAPGVAGVSSAATGKGGDSETRAGAPSAIAQGGAAPHLAGPQVVAATRVEGNTVMVVREAERVAPLVEDGGDPSTQPGAAAPHEAAPHLSVDAATAEVAAEIGYTGWPELAGRPAGDPAGFVPPYDSSAGDGPIEIQAAAETRIPGNIVVNLAIANIDRNPFQTRYVGDDEALEELAQSIKAQGVVQPIVVRPSEDDQGRYTLILGERRLHASKKAGKTHIPAIVRRVPEQQAAEMTIIENLQREDLSPLEQAEAFRVLSNQFNLTQQEIADRVGLSRVSISNYMRLLKLPRDVMQMLAEKRINFAKAKELLKLGDNDRIGEAALYAVQKGMNLEQIEMLVLRMDGLLDPLPDMPGVKKKTTSGGGARWVDPNVRAAQTELERTLGLRVRIRDRKGKGRIVIEYSTVDDYDRVVEMLRGKK
jgi:ParB family chromosome partitioning protein